jgi:hypothetical protein
MDRSAVGPRAHLSASSDRRLVDVNGDILAVLRDILVDAQSRKWS